jgi:transcriptional regulator with XRE-family HTH domain
VQNATLPADKFGGSSGVQDRSGPSHFTTEAFTQSESVDGTSHDERWLGLRLRALRRERKLSLYQLAELSGLSTGMLSQIERGLSSPSIRSLRLLGVALRVPISWFFALPEHEETAESRYIIRRGNRRLLKLSPTGVMKELLSPDSSEQMEMYELLLQPGGSSGTDFYSHQGEKAGVVVAGTLQLWLDEQAYILGEGDSFQFPSLLPHRFDNPGREPSRVIWMVTPPMPKKGNAPKSGSL